MNIIKKPYYLLSIILLLLLSACGSNPTASPDTGSISFNLQLSRPTPVSRTAAATSADICTDYGITTINATVLNSSGATVTTVSWACSAHEGTITGVPAGANYTVRLNGIDTNSSIIWRGEKSGIDTIRGTTAVAGTITMTYIGSDTTTPTVTLTSPSDNTMTVPVTTSLTVTFSEKMALSSINISTFTVSNGSTLVSGSVTYDPDTMEATFIPSGSLSYSTTYTATITTDVEDMAGNNMQSDYSWNFTAEAPPTSAPSAPTGVSATAGNNQVTITWDAVPGAASYNIYWSTTTGVTKTTGTKISGITSTSYTHTGLTNGSIYYFVVTAVNSFGESSESSEVSATPAIPPSVPTGVTASPGDGQATISWNAVSGATSYNIYWSTTTGVSKTTGTKISDIKSTSYIYTGLTNGTVYYYVVSAVNSFGESSESSEALVIPQAPISLPKTGQITCYDSSGNVISCAGTGQDGELQKGVAWPNPRFTDNGNSTMTDNLTGLVWTKDANAPGPAACSPGSTKTWQAALDYVACLNLNSYLGYIDWHLPNINELKSLVHAGTSDTATWLNSQGFNNVQSSDYWSSTSNIVKPSGASVVYMSYGGYAHAGGKSGGGGYVWPVRSGQSGLIYLPKTGQTICYDNSGSVIACAGAGQDGELQKGVAWPNPRFTDNGNSTMTDNLTGLVWTKDANAPGPAACSPGSTKTWQAALDYVACLNLNSYLGYTDWHLPNVNEIESIVHAGQSSFATWLNLQGFINVWSSYYYWSSTSKTDFTNNTWIVYMLDGYRVADYKPDNGYNYHHIWPVRSGQ